MPPFPSTAHPPRQMAAFERPLPPLPTHTPSFSHSHSHSNPRASSPPSTHRHRRLSSFAPRLNSMTIALFVKPRILDRFLSFLSWSDFMTFTQLCRTTRQLLSDQDAKDVVLSRYVPHYAYCRNLRNPKNFRDVPVSLHDLDLLVISQNFPLHQYPMHALSCAAAFLPTPEQEQHTRKLIALSQAHSRFVLLLQSLVHSSSLPPAPEPVELRHRLRAPQPNVRELTFPAPLSLPQPSKSAPALTTHQRPASDSSSIHPPSSFPLRSRSEDRPRSAQSSLSSRTTLMKAGRLSLFDFGRSGSGLPPPPPEEPKQLAYHSKSWRRSRVFATPTGSQSDDDTLAYSDTSPASTSDSSFSSSSTGITSSRSEPSSTRPSSSEGTVSMKFARPYLNINSLSPHDLGMATCMTRAPVLRVFVPSAEPMISEDDHYIARCEDQLIDFNIWEHLSTGDIVCNLGHVPQTPEDSPSGSRSRFSLLPEGAIAGQRGDRRRQPSRYWMIFDGEKLMPFYPPDPPPLRDILNLPSPFYYAHLSGSSDQNPVYFISRLPHRRTAISAPSLMHVPCKVKSPHSPMGYALVKKHVWIARVRVGAMDPDDHSRREEIGVSWRGEWVLEVEGTPEGRQLLELCVRKKPLQRPLQWEILREKSAEGKTWLKLLSDSSMATTRPAEPL